MSNLIYVNVGCERWNLDKRDLEAKVGAYAVGNFCNIILSSEGNSTIVALLKSKKFDLAKRSRMDV